MGNDANAADARARRAPQRGRYVVQVNRDARR
jgi:hypothetical protein